jgi:hypothetical protein
MNGQFSTNEQLVLDLAIEAVVPVLCKAYISCLLSYSQRVVKTDLSRKRLPTSMSMSMNEDRREGRVTDWMTRTESNFGHRPYLLLDSGLIAVLIEYSFQVKSNQTDSIV